MPFFDGAWLNAGTVGSREAWSCVFKLVLAAVRVDRCQRAGARGGVLVAETHTRITQRITQNYCAISALLSALSYQGRLRIDWEIMVSPPSLRPNVAWSEFRRVEAPAFPHGEMKVAD